MGHYHVQSQVCQEHLALKETTHPVIDPRHVATYDEPLALLAYTQSVVVKFHTVPTD
jgi:hypothetical protein